MPIKKAKIAGTPAKQGMTLEDAARSAIAYKQMQDDAKKLKADMDVTKKSLTDFLQANAEQQPTGHFVIATTFAGKAVQLKLEARNSTAYSVDILDRLKEEVSEDVYKKLVEHVPTLREDVLAQLIENGTIGLDVLEPLTEVTTSYAFKVQVK